MASIGSKLLDSFNRLKGNVKQSFVPRVNPVSDMASGAWNAFKSGPQAFGTGLGTSLQQRFFTAPLLQRQSADLALRNQANLLRMKQLRESGNIAGAKRLGQYNLNQVSNSADQIRQQQQAMQQQAQVGRGKLYGGAAQTALTLNAAGLPLRTLVGSALLGGGLGGGISAITGQNIYKGMGEGVGSSLKYAGLNKFTAPVIDPIVQATGRIAGPTIAKYGYRALAHGGLNLVEDELYTRATEQRPQNVNERVFSFLMGVTTSPMIKYDPKSSWLQITNDRLEFNRNKLRDAFGKYATADNAVINKQVKRMENWMNNATPINVRDPYSGEITQKIIPRWRLLRQEGGFIKPDEFIPGKKTAQPPKGVGGVGKRVIEIAKQSDGPTDLMWKIGKLSKEEQPKAAYFIGSKPPGYFDKLYKTNVSQPPAPKGVGEIKAKLSSSGNVYLKNGDEVIKLPKTIQNDIYKASYGEIPSVERRLKANSFLNKKGLEMGADGKISGGVGEMGASKPQGVAGTNLHPPTAPEPLGRISPQPAVSATKPQALVQPETIPQPTIPSSADSITDPVQKIVQALKEAKPLRGQQEKMYAQARSQKYAKMMSARGRVSGEKGFFAEKGALKGELPKAQFETLRKTLKQPDIDTLFNRINEANVGDWEKITAKTGLAKILEETGGSVPTRNELKLLDEVFGPEFTSAILDKRSGMQKLMATLADVINVPRALMASVDMSAPFRQGVFLIGRPKQFVPAFREMVKSFGSQKAYQGVMDEIAARPTYKLMRENRLALTQSSAKLAQGEEAFMSNLAERIPGIGRLVKASERAYTGFLNKVRADVFDDIYKHNPQLADDPKFIDSLATFVNSATGRGKGPKALEQSSQVLSGLLFSPRLMFSRLNLLNPAYYASLHPAVRKEALKSLFTFAGTGMAILGMAKLGGANVVVDPRNSDFGKIKVGNTRYDIWGGFQQYIKVAAQLLSGKLISSTTGKEYNLGEGYKPLTRADIALRFVEGKMAPVPSFVWSLFRGNTLIGDKFNVPTEIVNRLLPMMVQDMYDLQKEWGPKGYLMGIPGIFGVGSQTYGRQIPSIESTEAGNPTVRLKSVPGLAEDIVSKVTKTPVSNIPQEQWPTYIQAKEEESQLNLLKEKMKSGQKIPGNPATATHSIDGTEYKGYELNGKFVYTNDDGEVKTKSIKSIQKSQLSDEKGIIDANYSLLSDRLKRNKNSQDWNLITQQYIKYLYDYQAKLDPQADTKDIISIQNKIEDLQNSLSKGTGGGKRKKTISDAQLLSAYKKALEAAYAPVKTKNYLASLEKISKPITLKRHAVKRIY